MAMSLTKRGCKLSTHINARAEMDGEDPVPACDFTIHGMLLDGDELGELMNEPSIHNRWFNIKAKPVEPWGARKIAAYALCDKFEGAGVRLFLDGATSMTLKSCKLKNLRLEPQTGGLTNLSLTVQYRASADEIAVLYTHQGLDISASLQFGRVAKSAKAQPQLPLDHLGPNEVPGPLDEQQT
jgi:hypothetical protein